VQYVDEREPTTVHPGQALYPSDLTDEDRLQIEDLIPLVQKLFADARHKDRNPAMRWLIPR
jgi:hypothetical protein